MYARRLLLIVASFAWVATTAVAQDANPAPEKLIQHLKNDTAIRAYQWTETMVVSVEGKEKASVVNACTYNANGGVARTPATKQAVSAKSNLPGTTVEIEKYVKDAVALMRPYVRPDAAKLEKCEQAGRVTTVQEQNGLKLDFKDYEKPGDDLIITIDPANDRIISLTAQTYMINANDRAHIGVEMSQLPDGTSYPSRITFDTPSRQMGLTATNSDYRKKTS